MQYTYVPQGVCSREMRVEVNNGIVTSVQIVGGCSGNIQALCRLVEGLEANAAINKISGIHCGSKNTSCPDQLAIALKKALETGTDKSIQ